MGKLNSKVHTIIISGLSGSGKSVALQALEDIGYYCIDNLPLALLPEFIKQLTRPGTHSRLAAVSIDARNLDLLEPMEKNLSLLSDLGAELQLVFLQSDQEELVRRYSESRRKHPLSDRRTPLLAAIVREIDFMQPMKARANHIVDTTHLTPHELREQVRSYASGQFSQSPLLQFESFGFKHGVPVDADFVFDVRCLPNPHWQETLRPLTGLDKPVIDFLLEHEMVDEMVEQIGDFVENWLPAFTADNRSYLTIAVGCTGGRHRSVYVTQALQDRFAKNHKDELIAQVNHRDLT